MRINDIIATIQNNFYFALIMIVILALFMAVGYFLVYKRFLKGDKNLDKRKVFIWFCFMGYIIMVIGVTFIGRGVRTYGDSNLHFLSTYREAWNSFSTTSWTQLLLNIIMLVPLGIILPLINNRFRKFKWTIVASLLFTLTIETIQILTGYGVFDLDDIFNNMIGAIVGYGIVMTFITLVERERKQYKLLALYLLPLISVIILSITIIGVYNTKEFGNLFIAYKYKINMKNIELSLNTEIDDKQLLLNNNSYNIEEVPIYKTTTYDKDYGEQFFRDFLKDKDIDEEIEVDPYDTMAIYWYRSEGYSMSFNYNGGSYDYTDFSSFDEGVDRADADKENIEKELKKLDISIPEAAVFSKNTDSDGLVYFEWSVENYVDGEYIINGSLSAKYYDDSTIKSLENNIIKYKKVRDVRIISKEEVYERFKEGKFNIYNGKNIKNIEVEEIKLSYMIDSKGFYQPIYKFELKIDGVDQNIYIPAL